MRKLLTNWLALTSFATLLILATGCNQRSDEKEMEEYDGPGHAAAFDIERTKDPATGKVPWHKLIISMEQTELAKNMLRNGRTEATQTLSWQERGPNGDFPGPNGNSRPAGQQTSGRVRATMVDSLDPNHNTVWVGGVNGGLWKTTDITASPATWTPVNDFLSNLAVAAICQDPRPGFQNIMYFCTGESYFNADAVRGVGVFKSIDAGATWSFLPSTSTYVNGTRILCDFQGNVYLGTRGNGLLRSGDGGTTWTTITPTGTGTNICDLEISSTAVLARLHVVMGIGSAQSYRYTDIPSTVTSGSGWTAPAAPFPTFNERAEIAVSGNVLYALPSDNGGNVTTIYKSVNGGANWTNAGSTPNSFNIGSFANTQGWYDLSVGINPANPDECIVGAVDCAKTTTGGGGTWTRITAWAGTAGPYVHADQHGVTWWDGGTKLMFNCDGGIHFSTNGGTTINDRNKGLRIKQFYSVAIHPLETNYFIAGAQDNGCHRLNHPGLDSSIEITGGDGCYVAIDQNEPHFQFGSYVGNVYRRSTNNGATWSTPVNTGGGRFVNPWDYDNDANTVYACNASGNFLRWPNANSANATSIVTCAQFGGNVSAVHVSPYTANRVFFGMGNGGVVMVDNANTGSSVTGTVITPTGASGAYANCIVTGSSDQHLMAIYSNYGITNIYVSSNGGTNWTPSDGNLPDMPVRWALFHPDSDTKAFIATETGVWETELLDGANTVWTPNLTFPNCRTDMIKYRASDRLIAAGTHGRGIWTANVPAAGGFSFNAPGPITATCPASNPMTATLTATYNGAFSNPITLSSSVSPAGPTVTFGTNPLTTGSPSTTVNITNASSLAPGNYTVTVTGTATGASTQNRDIIFTITAGAGPAITGHPADQSICNGDNTSFTVTSPTATSFKWQVNTASGFVDVINGGVYGGAGTATLTLTNVPVSFNGNLYRAIATIACGSSTSNNATLTVNSSATITGQPQDATLCAGSNHTFGVTATGTGLSYLWSLSTDGGTIFNPLSDGGVYSGTATANLVVTGITAGMNNYKYRVSVAGTGACATPVVSSIATLTVVTSVTITTQPINQTVCAGANTTFTVAGSGSGIIYQWQVNDGSGFVNVPASPPYSGTATNTLTITGATVSMNGYEYRALLSNSTCSTPGTSNTATLTVNSLPAITAQPANATVCTGGNTSFTSGATGTGVGYQWQLSTDGGGGYSNISDGGVYSGTTTTTLVLTNVTLGMNNYRYRMIATGTCPPQATSNGAILTVANPVTLTQQPANAEICAGQNATFTVTGTSSETISYQWSVSTSGGPFTPIPGATSASYTVTGATIVMSGNQYRVSMTNISCSTPTVSNAALLTVRPLPTVTLSAAPFTSLQPGQTTTLTATSGASAGGILVTSWLFNGSPTVPPIVGSSYVVNVEKVGAYQVRIDETWPSGLFCSALSQTVTIVAPASSRLFIFPSPNDGRFTVSYYNNGGASTQRIISIFDSKGSLVLNKSFNITGSYTLIPIDMQTANRGIYYVAVGDAQGKKLAEGKVHIR